MSFGNSDILFSLLIIDDMNIHAHPVAGFPFIFIIELKPTGTYNARVDNSQKNIDL